MSEQEANVELNTIESTNENDLMSDGFNYEPSIQVRKTYLPLRKQKRIWGGVDYPGLFNHDPANDAGWFWFTVTMEMMSLGMAAFLLEERVSSSVLLISASSVFFLDFAFAYFHHKFKETESISENRKRLFFSHMRSGPAAAVTYSDYFKIIEQQYKDDKNRKYTRYIFGFLIWLLSLTKGGIFFVAVFSSFWFQTAVSDSKAPYLLIIVVIASYFWIALNHLNYTGYYIASYFNKIKYNSEEADHKRNYLKLTEKNKRVIIEERVNFKNFIDDIMKEKHNNFIAKFSMKSEKDIQDALEDGIIEIRIKNGTHFIKRVENQEDFYIFQKNGFLLDDQIDEMVRVQKNDLAQFAVAMYFHKLQMSSTSLNGD
jgi:hypothetical protein